VKHDEDPEVVADLQLRARTERERGGRAAREPSWSPPVIAARWRCRGCKSDWLVDVPVDAVAAYLTFNEELKRRGEEPLDESRIVFCDECRDKGRRMAPEGRRNQVERLRSVIQKLKASRRPEEERELILQCTALGHPDVEGLVSSLRDKRAAKQKGPPV
jgi:hypothetical protein